MNYKEYNNYAIVNGDNDKIVRMFETLEEAVDKWKENFAGGLHKVVKINGIWEME